MPRWGDRATIPLGIERCPTSDGLQPQRRGARAKWVKPFGEAVWILPNQPKGCTAAGRWSRDSSNARRSTRLDGVGDIV
jgi:hypothetical protein